MKRYLVKTQSSVNEMLLHSTMQREFSTDDLAEQGQPSSKRSRCWHRSMQQLTHLSIAPATTRHRTLYSARY